VWVWVIPNPHPLFWVSPKPKLKLSQLGFLSVDSDLDSGGPREFGHTYDIPSDIIENMIIIGWRCKVILQYRCFFIFSQFLKYNYSFIILKNKLNITNYFSFFFTKLASFPKSCEVSYFYIYRKKYIRTKYLTLTKKKNKRSYSSLILQKMFILIFVWVLLCSFLILFFIYVLDLPKDESIIVAAFPQSLIVEDLLPEKHDEYHTMLRCPNLVC
jgi:hypothetical protein